MNLIVSEQQAEKLGKARTGGAPGKAFTVFSYRHRTSGLTVFAIEIVATKEIIAVA